MNWIETKYFSYCKACGILCAIKQAIKANDHEYHSPC